MILGDVKSIALSKIIGPGDVKRRQKTENVLRLAEGFPKRGGRPLHPLICQKTKKGWEIVSGRDRYSALLLIKAKATPVTPVLEATPLELLEAEIEENLTRRADDRDSLLADLVERAAALLPGNLPDNSERQPGRPTTTRGEARRLVAEAEGTTPEAVRRAEGRAKSRSEETERHGAQGDPAPAGERAHETPAVSPIETFGHPLPAHVLARVTILLDACDGIEKASRAALRALTELEHGIHGGDVWALTQRLREAARALGGEARAARPKYLCPKCDGADLGDLCKLCGHEGSITEDQYAALPPEQKNGGSAHAAGLDAAPVEPEFDSPAWHRKIYGIHCDNPGPGVCGCKSCNACRRADGVAEVHPGAKEAAPAKPKRGMRVVMPGSDEARPLDEVVAELTVERDDDDAAWSE